MGGLAQAVCRSDSSPVMGEAYFSAVCYFFGREMFRKNQVIDSVTQTGEIARQCDLG